MAVKDDKQNVTKCYRGSRVDGRVMEGTWAAELTKTHSIRSARREFRAGIGQGGSVYK